MAEERRGDAREGIKEGLKAGLGILGALKEALEETFEEAMKERDFDPDRARDAFKDTVKRAQAAMDDAKDRFDFVGRRDFDALRGQVEALRHQLEMHLTSSVHHEHGPGGAARAEERGGHVHGEMHTHPGGPTHSHPGGAEPHMHDAEMGGTGQSTGGAGEMPDGGFGAGSGAGPTAAGTGAPTSTPGTGGTGMPGPDPGTVAGEGRPRDIPLDEPE